MSENKDGGDISAKLEAAKAEGAKGAVAAYQARRKAVMAFDETKGREGLAEHLIETEMSDEAIKATLAKAPKAEAAQQEPAAPTVEDYAKARMSGGVPQPGGQPGTKSTGWGDVVASANKRRAR